MVDQGTPLLAPLPDALKGLVDREFGEALRISVCSDMLHEGTFGESWLLADASEFAVYCRQNGTWKSVMRHALSELSDATVREGVGSGVLEVTRDGGTFRIIRFSAAQRQVFAEAARLLREWTACGEWQPVSEKLDHEFCPRCARPLPEGSDSCASCTSKGHLLKRSLAYVKPYWLFVLGLVGCMAVSTLIGLVSPYLGKILVDDVIKPLENQHLLVPLAVTMLACYLLQAVVEGLSMALAARVGTHAVYDVRGATFRRLQELSLSYYSKRQTGVLITRVNQDTEQLHRLMIDFIPHGINMVLIVAGVLALLVYLSPLLTLCVLVPVVAMIVFIRIVFPSFRIFWDRFFERRARLTGYVTDVITGVRVVKAFGQEAAELDRFAEKSQDYRNAHLAAETRMAKVIPVFHVIAMSGTPIVWLVGGLMVFRGAMTLGTIIAYTGYLMMLFRPIFMLSRLAQLIPNALAAAGRVFDVLDTDPEITDAPDAVSMPDISGQIEFRNVTFAYEQAKPVLKDFTLEIQPGEHIGLVGHSGAGKSTTISLICRFYDVDAGAILIDGTDIRNIRYGDLRNQISVVLQETFLLHGTIADNIAYARPGATPDAIIEAARVANAHDFILKKPEAYDTMVEEGGKNLSVGEKQRIAIARAVLCNPRILILDEATASVDIETEKQIQEALSRLIRGRTTISIAHRLSTLKNADRLVVLKDGQIAETGTHEELMNRQDGVFSHLASMHTELSRVHAIGG